MFIYQKYFFQLLSEFTNTMFWRRGPLSLSLASIKKIQLWRHDANNVHIIETDFAPGIGWSYVSALKRKEVEKER